MLQGGVRRGALAERTVEGVLRCRHHPERVAVPPAGLAPAGRCSGSLPALWGPLEIVFVLLTWLVALSLVVLGPRGTTPAEPVADCGRARGPTEGPARRRAAGRLSSRGSQTPAQHEPVDRLLQGPGHADAAAPDSVHDLDDD